MATIKDSKYQKIRDQCLALGKPWEDPDFPADATSIGLSSGSHFSWKRPHEICGIKRKPEFILDGADRFDVIQGHLGDCWVLASLASLAASPSLFKRVVPHDQTFHKDSYTGVFRFHFWKYGEWTEVLVDDRLPCRGSRVQYAKPSAVNEFWAPLAEKAYAKFYGNYTAIATGRSCDAFTDFTGSLTETLLIPGNPAIPPLQLMNILLKAMKKNYIMSASVNRPVRVEMGITSGHAYSITDVKKVTLEYGSEICMIRIRNPWGGNNEWTGAWSDSSDKWNTLSPAARKTLNHISKDDGEFWMELTDFMGYFKKVDICYLTAADMSACPQQQGSWPVSTFYGKLGGNHTKSHPSYQIAVTVKDGDDADDKASFVVELTQMNRRRKHRPPLCIGLSIFRPPPGAKLPLSKTFVDDIKNTVAQIRFAARAVSRSLTDVPGTYVIVPTVLQQNEETEFMLRVFSETNHTSHKI